MAFLLGVGLVTKTAASVDTTLRHDWRGSYDLLVLPGAGSPVRAQEGLVEPNFGDYSKGGISQAQWRAVLGLPDVAVAAPVEFLGQLQSPKYDMDLAWSQGLTACQRGTPTAYRLSYEVTDDAGPRQVLVAKEHTDVVEGCPDSGTPYLDKVDQTPGIDGSDAGTSDGRAAFDVSGAGVPVTEAGVIAVDPVEESKLLGSQSAFLRPLSQYDATPTPGKADALIPHRYWQARAGFMKAAKDGTVVPLVVSTTGYAPLSATVSQCRLSVDLTGLMKAHTVSGVIFGEEPTSAGERAIRAAANSCTHPVTKTSSITSRIIPFANDDLDLTPPGMGSIRGPVENGTAGLVPTSVGSLDLTDRRDPGSRGPAYAVAPQGQTRPGAPDVSGPAASEQTYRPAGHQGPASNASVVWAPLGTYNPASIRDTSAASYVPLGTYAPATTTITSGPAAGKQLQPSLTGRGLVLPAPAAVTSLQAAHALNPNASIAFIRVRVAGLGAYGPDARAKLAQAASQITRLGLRVRVMAGSSVEPVNLYLARYFPASHGPAGSGGSGGSGTDLGWVVQDWTSLGAAVRVQRASTSGSFELFFTVLGIAVLAAGFVLAADTRRRRLVEGRQLTQLGWRRMRIARWWLAEDAPVIGVVILAAAISLLFASSTSVRVVTAVAGVCFLALVVASPLAALWLPARTVELDHDVTPTSTATGLGLRSSLHRGSGFAPVVLAVAAVGVLVALVCVVLHNQALARGTTRLAGVAASRSAGLQIGLGVLGLGCTVGLAVLSLRIVGQRLGREARLLRQVGWTPQAARRYFTVAQLPPVGAALALALVITAVLASHADRGRWVVDLGWAAGAVVLAAFFTTTWTVLSASSKGWES